jgi:hypothetical protein
MRSRVGVAGDEPVVVIGHSLGSVVSYRVVTALEASDHLAALFDGRVAARHPLDQTARCRGRSACHRGSPLGQRCRRARRCGAVLQLDRTTFGAGIETSRI